MTSAELETVRTWLTAKRQQILAERPNIHVDFNGWDASTTLAGAVSDLLGDVHRDIVAAIGSEATS